jgi:hypothetical protein
MQRASLSFASLLVLSSFPAIANAQSQSPIESDRIAFGNLLLRPTSRELLDEVCPGGGCLNDPVRQLSEIPPADRCGVGPPTIRALLLRQEIAEAMQTASLEVDGFLAEADSETAQIRAVRDRLTSERDIAIGHSTWGGATGAGGGAVASSLALATDTAVTVGNWIGATFGAAGAYYGFLGILQAQGPKGCFPDLRPNDERRKKEKGRDCISLPIDSDRCLNASGAHQQITGCTPRMLSNLIDPEMRAGFHSTYDTSVKTYLSHMSPGETATRAELLFASWGGKSEVEKETFLVSGNDHPVKMRIDDLTERINKLADLRAVVARLNRDLSRLSEDLAVGLRCPGSPR